METNSYFPIFTTLAGALVGGMISEFRNIVQLRRDARRARNKLLYNLLDIWCVLKTMDIGFVFEKIIAKFSQKFNVPIDQMRKEFQGKPDIKYEVIKRLLERIPTENLEKKYQDSVDDLGPHDPILAYRMSGKGVLLRYDDIYSGFRKSLDEDNACGDSLNKFIDHMKSFSDKKTTNEALIVMEDDILIVASKISRRTRKSVSEIIKKIKCKSEEELEILVEEFVDHICVYSTVNVTKNMEKGPHAGGAEPHI